MKNHSVDMPLQIPMYHFIYLLFINGIIISSLPVIPSSATADDSEADE